MNKTRSTIFIGSNQIELQTKVLWCLYMRPLYSSIDFNCSFSSSNPRFSKKNYVISLIIFCMCKLNGPVSNYNHDNPLSFSACNDVESTNKHLQSPSMYKEIIFNQGKITFATQSANSFALGTVADRNTNRDFFGAITMLSSQTTPLSRSRM